MTQNADMVTTTHSFMYAPMSNTFSIVNNRTLVMWNPLCLLLKNIGTRVGYKCKQVVSKEYTTAPWFTMMGTLRPTVTTQIRVSESLSGMEKLKN